MNITADGTPILKLGAEQFRAIQEVLVELCRQSRSDSVLLCDVTGLAVTFAGILKREQAAPLAALAAANYAATQEMARLVGQSGFALNFYQADQADLVIEAVDERYLLVIVFGKGTSFGMVRLLSGKARKELARLAMQSSALEKISAAREKPDTIDDFTARLESVFPKADGKG